jgi:hypothetical protein
MKSTLATLFAYITSLALAVASDFTFTVKIQSSNDAINWTDTGFQDIRHYNFETNQLFIQAYTYFPTNVPPAGKRYVSYSALSGSDVLTMTTPFQSIGFVLLNSNAFYRPVIAITVP